MNSIGIARWLVFATVCLVWPIANLRADEPTTTVTVHNEQGKAVSGAIVALFSDKEMMVDMVFDGAMPPAVVLAGSSSDEDGKAILKNVPKGNYFVTIRHPDYRISPFFTRIGELRAFTFRLLPRTTVLVRDEDNLPLKDVFVSANATQFADHSLLALSEAMGDIDDRTGEGGTFVIKWEIPVRAGDPSAVVASHRASGRTAIAVLTPKELLDPVELILRPTRLVRATLDLGSAQERAPSLRWTDRRGRSFFFNTSTVLEGKPGHYEAKLRLPPESYQLVVATSEAETLLPFKVVAGNDDLDLGTIKMTSPKLVQMVGKESPELSLRRKDYKALRLADLRGKVVVLYFWATWCRPCVVHMPELIDLSEKLRGQPVQFVAIHESSMETFAELDERLTEFQKNMSGGRRLDWTMALDEASDDETYRGVTTANYGVRFFPTIVVIDQDGKVVGAVEKEKLESTIRKLTE